ncbi:MAG: VOC family protein [Rhodobacteraceae bacterium]|nr:VOC family protein [Paracoccaceae bacterium]
METYAAIFDATPEMMPASAMGDAFPVPDDKKDWIMHASLKIGAGDLMASDDIFGTSGAMQGASVMLSYPTVAEAKTIFEKLSDGSEITMPFAPTFWSLGFGTLTDRFGVHWMVGSDETPDSA